MSWREQTCPLHKQGWRTTRWPGTRDQCPACGRIVYTRADGTCRPHDKPGARPKKPPAKLYLASFGSYSWDALAIGRTKHEAKNALIANVMKNYPACQYTPAEWDEDMSIREVTLPYAEVS